MRQDVFGECLALVRVYYSSFGEISHFAIVMNFTVASHEAEILGQAGIIYAMLLGGSAIIGSILFGIRQLTLERSPDTETTTFASKETGDGIELKTIETTLESHTSPKNSPDSEPSRVDVIRLLDSGNTLLRSPIRLSPLSNCWTASGPISLRYDEVPWLPIAQRNMWLKDLYDVQKSMAQDTLALQEDLQALKRINLSQCVYPSVVIPPIRFLSVWRADQAVEETKQLLLDPSVDNCTKTIGLVRLAGLAAAKAFSLAVNPFSLYSFQALIEQLVDTGLVFQIIAQLPQPKYSMLLVVDTVASYSWHVWTDARSKAAAYGGARVMVIRTFCNLLLGLDGESTPQFVQMKLSILMEKMILATRCHEYLTVVPMVAQGINIAVGGRTKTVFYDAVFVMVVKHRHCCMEDEYLQQSTVLQQVVSDGMASHNPKEREKAMRLRQEVAGQATVFAANAAADSLDLSHASAG